jgi:hypothetical protein
MPKGKIAAEAVKRGIQGAKIGGGAVLAEKAVDVLDSKALSAAEGALIGGAAASVVPGLGTAAGAVAGGTLGWFLGDSRTVFPVDMVCIPAYQAYMIQGTPAFTIYARAGETLMPTGGNVQDVQEAIPLAEASNNALGKKKPRSTLSKWNKYVKNKRNHIRYKSGKNKGKLNLKAMAKKGGFGGRK